MRAVSFTKGLALFALAADAVLWSVQGHIGAGVGWMVMGYVTTQLPEE